ncbi:IS3 family transposase [Paenibacillus hubeiensis]
MDEAKHRRLQKLQYYYNHDRGQWNLKKLPPVKYRQQLQ